MASNRKYYTLITSLPSLPRFDRAKSLPINRERLLQRLKMLEPEDWKLASRAVEFIAWRGQMLGKSDAEMVAVYNEGVQQMFSNPSLKTVFEFPVNQRTILTALRRKQKGLPRPKLGQLWGAGSLVKPIENNWNEPFFRLNTIYPWIVQADAYLKEGESYKLEHLLKTLVWDKLDHLLLKNYFGFEVIIAYLLKWDLIQQWLSCNQEQAKSRFEELIIEVIHEQKQNSEQS